MRTEDEIKYRLALLVESLDSSDDPLRAPRKVIAIRELEWVLGIREK